MSNKPLKRFDFLSDNKKKIMIFSKMPQCHLQGQELGKIESKIGFQRTEKVKGTFLNTQNATKPKNIIRADVQGKCRISTLTCKEGNCS